MSFRFPALPPALLRGAFWCTLVAVLVLSLLPVPPPLPDTGWDKTNHLLAFAVLAFLGCWGYAGRMMAMALGLLAYGGLIECLQALTTYRFAEWGDLLADAIGIAIGLALYRPLARWLARGRPPASPPMGVFSENE